MSRPSHTTPPEEPPRRQPTGKTPPAAFPTLEPFARRLESLRRDRGLTQRAMAARSHISTNHYQDIAHARANPSVIVLLRLAQALGVSLVELFDSGPPAPSERQSVLIADLEELATAHKRLTDVVERLAKNQKRARSSDNKRQ